MTAKNLIQCDLAGKQRGCKFSPRYDEVLPEMKWNAGNANSKDLALIVEALKNRIYVRDVCERCGRTVEHT